MQRPENARLPDKLRTIEVNDTERMIHPKRKDIPRLKEIWLDCFPEDKNGYCDFFFENRFIPERITALENGGRICGAVYFFDAFFTGKDGKKYPFLMSFGAGVAQCYRGNNGMFRMYAHACKEAFSVGISGIIAFATDELVEAYDRHGFRRLPCIYRTVCIVDESIFAPKWHICGYDEFRKCRESFLKSKEYFFDWEEKSLAFMYKDVFTSGAVLCCEYKGVRFYAVCSVSDGDLIIRETDFPPAETSVLAAGIGRHFGRDRVLLYSTEPVSNARCEKMYYGHYLLSDSFPFPDDMQRAYINIIAD